MFAFQQLQTVRGNTHCISTTHAQDSYDGTTTKLAQRAATVTYRHASLRCCRIVRDLFACYTRQRPTCTPTG